MRYVGKAVLDDDCESYGIVVEYKKDNFSYDIYYPYRIYYPKDGYDDWFTTRSTKDAIKRLEDWRKSKCR